MVDASPVLSTETPGVAESAPADTQLAEAGRTVAVTEPQPGFTTIQPLAPDEALQLAFDPAAVDTAAIEDGNLVITFDNGGVVVLQGYEAWAQAGGQATGPQGGAVDMAQLMGAPEATTAPAEETPQACAAPGENVNVVEVPVPAAGERITLAAQPGDALRLACSFRDVAGQEIGDTLEMTFPGGGIVVVENFSAWLAAEGATITDCVCGGINLADFIVALGMVPEEIIPAAGDSGGPGGDSDLTGSGFTPGPGPQILSGLPYPNILPPTELGYGVPEPDQGLSPGDDDLGGPLAQDDPPDAVRDVLTVRESTRPAAILALTAASGDGEGGEGDAHDGCAPPIGPQEFQPDQTTFKVITNDTFGPDGAGEPPITAFHYNGDPSLVDNPDGVLDGNKLVITSTDPVNQWHAEMIISGPDAGQFTFFLDGPYVHDPIQGENEAFEAFSYTIQDSDGDSASANVTVSIVDSIPVANGDCEICFTEPGVDAEVIPPITGNVMANDDLGADQFLPEGTDLISFTYTAADDEGNPIQATANAGETVTTFIGGELTVNENGDWSYTPPATVDNSEGDVHDDFSYTIRDGDGDVATATQPICIQDGAEPEAFDNKQCVAEQTQNFVIIADVSGSMDDDDIDPDTAGIQTRLDLEKASLLNLVQNLAGLNSEVTVTLIAFASGNVTTAGGADTDGAIVLGTFTFNDITDQGYLDAVAAVNSLAIGFGPLNTETEYDDALLTAQQVLQGQLPGQAPGTLNTVFFLSDGEPNPASNDADAAGWQTFADNNGIEVVAVGIGGDVSSAELAEVEDNGETPLIVDDQGDLPAALNVNIGNAAVSGNVLTDPTEEPNISPANDPVGSVDDPGSDGYAAAPITQFVHDGITYTKDSAVGGTVLANDGAGTITILTDLGATLQFNFLTGAYTYTAPASVQHGAPGSATDDEVEETFEYTIQDGDGDTDPAVLVICIKDGEPIARNDTDALSAGEFGPETGNVISAVGATSGAAGADTPGPDGAKVAAVQNADTGDSDDTADGGSFTVNGLYGVLTINEDGSYSYLRNQGTPGGVQDVFTYTLRDGDGDIDTATLTIDIGDDTPTVDIPTAGEAGTQVFEKGLPARDGEPEGSGEAANPAPNSDQSEITTGSIVFTEGDGPAKITIGGVVVDSAGDTVQGAFGVLEVTGIDGDSVEYKYTLSDNTSGDTTKDTFAVEIADKDGDKATGSLVIDIVDDVPTAENDTDSIPAAQFGPATGNVITDAEGDGGKDTVGADNALVSKVSSDNVGGSDEIAEGGNFVLNGEYGVLTLNQDGTYSYLRNQGTPGGVQDVFTYTLRDGDGDIDTATLTISIGDDTPTVDIPTAGEAGTEVFEKGLPARNGEPEGSGEAANPAPNSEQSEITAGSILFTDGDGPAKISIGGVVVDSAGDTVQGAFGVLEVTGIDGDSVEYKYTLADNTSGDATKDTFAIEIADKDGDKASGSLVIDIVDDVPTAENDTDSIPAAQFGPAIGNVITDAEGDGGKDTVGADNALVSKVSSDNVGGSDEIAEGGNFVLNGEYGVLTLNQDGTYSYLRNQGTPGGVQDVFTYTLRDGDGDIDTATLTISIGDDTPTVDIPTAGEAGTEVFEKGLPARNGEPEGSGEAANPAPNSDQSEITTGSILFTDGDGPAKISIGGVVVDSAGDTVQGAFGVLEVTGIDGDSVEYKYTLSDNTSGDATKDTFAVEIADKDGDTAGGNLVIDIVDDVPTANDDTDSIPSGQFGPATGNVITDAEGDGGKDTVGADNALVSKVSSDNIGGSDEVAEGGNFVLNGEYGVLTLNQDGTYSYLRNQGTPGGVQDVFTYTLRDGDGDTDTATLTINIGDKTPTVDVPVAGEAGTQVFEKGLPARNGEPEGSGEAANPAPNSDQSEITAGSILFTDGDGPAKISIGGVVVDSAGDTVQGAFGVLEVTGIDGDSVEYKYTLSDNTGGDATKDTFAVEIADKDGDKATGSLVIDIVDDVPTAENDADSIPGNQFGPATGNVITDAEGDGGKDTVGADNALVSKVSSNNVGGSDEVAEGGNFVLNGQYGVLTLNQDGSYSYLRNQGTPGGVQDVFTYTLKDGDGDIDTATLTINIGDDVPTVDIPTAGEAGTQVFEKGLPARNGEPEGSGEAANPAPNSDQSEITTGSILFTDGDGPAKISIGGVVVDSAGDTVQGAFGVLEVTGIDGDSVEYKYTLSDNTSGDATKDTFAVEIADKDGDKASGNLVIDIVDDVPTANDDTDSVGAGGKATGNVITGAGTTSDGSGDDVVGADNAVVADIDFGATDGDVGKGIAGNFGTLILNADGTYEYQAKANVSGKDVFTYTLKDGDGDTETATLTIDVGASTPVVNPATDTVDEAALDLSKDGKDLAAGTTTGSNPSSTDETETGTLVFSDPDGALISKITFNGADFTDAGDGSADGFITVNTPLGLLKVEAASGNYTYTLEDNSLKHNTQGTGIDGVNETFTYTVTDTLGNSNNSSLVISIQDDVPTANADTTDTASDEVVNIVIVFDRSGSMDENPSVNGYSTRIDLARAAVAALLETFGSFATVNVMVVDFASDADNSGWGSIEDANAYLAALEADGTTNYAAAVNETMNNYADGLPAADRSLVYFVSDGKPNPANTSLSSQGLVDDWQNFLEDTNVQQAFAIGVGNGIPANDPDLEDVAQAVVVTDDLLLDTLVSTVGNVVVGSVLTDGPNDQFGADGPGSPQIVSIVVAGFTYTYNGTDIFRNGVLFAAGTSVLIVATALAGGQLEFNFANGGYEYTVPNSNTDEVFTYTIRDADGDTSSANLTFLNTADTVVQPNRVFGTNDNNNLNGTGSIDIIGGDDGNDTASGGGGDDHITGGAGTDNLVGGSGNDIIIGGSQSQFENQTIRAADGADTIDGGEGDDFIVGNQGDDLLTGGLGADTILGGFGVDIISGGQGNDSIDLAGGGNDVVRYTSTLDGHDVITGFDANNDSGTDQLNLDALFDALEATLGSLDAAARAARVQIVDNGTTVEININTDASASFNLHVATINTTTDSTVTTGQEIIVGS